MLMENAHISINGLFHENKEDVFNQLLHSCIDEICGYPGPTFEKFRTIVEWSESDYHTIYKLISGLLRNPMSLYLDEDKMPLEYYEFPEYAQQRIMTCLKVRQERLADALLRDFAKKECPMLIDFDWRIKYVMGSSKMASLREPLVQLDLMLDEKHGERVLALELGKTELDTLINSLETMIR